MLKWVDVSIIGATTLGEDNNRHALDEALFGIVHGFNDAARRVVIYHNVPCHVTCPSHEREIVKPLAHHPLEVMTQIAIDGEYVIGSLMIGNKNVCALAINEMTILYPHSHPKEETHSSCPPLGRIIAPIVAIEKATNNGDKTGDNGEYQHYRCSNAVVIYSVKDVHANVICVSNYKVSKKFSLFRIHFSEIIIFVTP